MTPDQQRIKDLEDTVGRLKRDLEDLTGSYWQGNFLTSQDFSKYCRFNTRLKIPSVSALPAVAEQGEVVEYGGTLYIASASNVWTVAGSQV